MFLFPSVICTRCTGFFCLAIIKGPPNDIYFIIEEPSNHYFTEKVSHSLGFGGYIFSPEPHMFNCKIYMLHNILFHKIFYFCFRKKYMSFHIAHILARIAL